MVECCCGRVILLEMLERVVQLQSDILAHFVIKPDKVVGLRNVICIFIFVECVVSHNGREFVVEIAAE